MNGLKYGNLFKLVDYKTTPTYTVLTLSLPTPHLKAILFTIHKSQCYIEAFIKAGHVKLVSFKRV